MAASTLSEGGAGLETSGEGVGTKNPNWGLKDFFSKGPIWVVNGECDGGILF